MSSQDPNVGNVVPQISSDVSSPDDPEFDTNRFLLDEPTDDFGTNNSPQEEIQVPQTSSANVGRPYEGSSSQESPTHVGNISSQISSDVRSPDDPDFDISQFLLDQPTDVFGTNNSSVNVGSSNPNPAENFRQDLANPSEESGPNDSLVQNFLPGQHLPNQTSSGNVGTSNINPGNIHPPQNLTIPFRYQQNTETEIATSAGNNNQTLSPFAGWMDSRGRSTRFNPSAGENTNTMEGNARTSSGNVESSNTTSAGNNNQTRSPFAGWVDSRGRSTRFNPSAGENNNTLKGSAQTSSGNVVTSNINPENIQPRRNLAIPLGYQHNTSTEYATGAGNDNQTLSEILAGWMRSSGGSISFNPSAGANTNTLEGNAPAVEIGGGQSRNEGPVVPPAVINRPRKPRGKLPALAEGLTWLRVKKTRKKKEINLGPPGDHSERCSKTQKNPGEIGAKGKGISDLRQRSSQDDQNLHANPCHEPTLLEYCNNEFQRVLHRPDPVCNQLPSQGTGGSTNLPSDSVNSVAPAEAPVVIEGSNNSKVATETQVMITDTDNVPWVEDQTDNAAPRPEDYVPWVEDQRDNPALRLEDYVPWVEDQTDNATEDHVPWLEDQRDDPAPNPEDIDDFEKWRKQLIRDFDSTMGSDSAYQGS